jgi:choice-of-anchor B domain-containing protein
MFPPRHAHPSQGHALRRNLPWLVLTIASLIAAAPVRAQDSRNVTLLSSMNLYANPTQEWSYSTVWSYVHSDGREYAVLAAVSGVSIVRLTDPAHPVEVAFINLRDSGWHESRQYGNRIYVVTEVMNGYAATCGLEIINMEDPDHPKKVSNYNSNILYAHSLEIDTARGYLYANGADGGMHIYSLATPDNPVEIGRYPRYVHDLHLRGTLGFASLVYDGAEHVLDLTNPASPVLLAEFFTPLYTTHSAWTTQDGRYLYVTDETIGKNLTVYDIQNFSAIQRVWRHEISPQEIVHHPRIKGTTAFISHYTRGVRLWDVSNGGWPVEYGYFDSSPYPYGGFHGNWEVAPFFPSGIFAISDMQTGLYVLRATPNYSLVRGTVRDVDTGAPVEGATVRVVGATVTTKSASDGRYGIAPNPGHFTLETSAFGYLTDTRSLNLNTREDRAADVMLVKRPGSIRGRILDAGSQAGLGFAELDIAGTPLRAVSDATGAFVFPAVPEGTYQVRCARPGYATRTQSANVQRSRETALNFTLSAAAYYDGFDTDRGWVVGSKDDDTQRGIWERGVPQEVCLCYLEEPQLIQPGADHSPDPGSMCWVTGASRISFFPIDGQTTLTSPVLSVLGITDPRIAFWRWYVNLVTSFPGDDPFVTQLSGDGGQTWQTVSTVYFPPAGWEYVELRVRDYFPTGNGVRVRFIAADRNEFSENESLIDDFAIFGGTGGGALASSIANSGVFTEFGRPGPSPTRGPVRMNLSLAAGGRLSAEVYDVRGRLVAVVQDKVLPAGRHVVEWNGRGKGGEAVAAGVYFMQVRYGDQARREKFVVLR